MAAGVIFDCDGTLLDTIDAWHEVEDRLLSDAGITLSKAERDELSSLTLDEAGEFFFVRFDGVDSPQQVRDLIVEHLLEFYRTRSTAVAGAEGFVEALGRRGVPMAVLSSSPQSFLQAGLGRTAMAAHFRAVVSVDDVEGSKRDRETYHHVCGLLGTDPAETWFFDDSWYALKAAREAGLRTVGVFSSDNCGTHEELARYSECVIEDFTGLPDSAADRP